MTDRQDATQRPSESRFAFLDAEAALDPESLEGRLRAALAPSFQLVRSIGAGGMARVFLAREPALKRLVAVKVLSADLAASVDARARFEREAQAVAALSHPNIVNVHAVGEMADGTPYFVMQYVKGRSMAARLDDEGPLSIPDVRRALGEVAAALATAHRQGIIHRDIKPANILYEEATGRSLVSDFGIAAVAPVPEAKSLRLTGTGIAIGTPQYMSPEQLLAEPVSEKTDVYSLGLLAHELLVGSGPFRGSSPNELIAAHLRDIPARLATRRGDVDAELDELIARCLEKDATKRPGADEISRRLLSGGVSLLEWPPPGLAALHGKLRRQSLGYWIGGILVLAAMIPFVIMGTTLNSPISAPAYVLLPLLAVGGFLVLLATIRQTLKLGQLSASGRRAGYAWTSILEVMADHDGSTGNIVTGSREYATLTPEQRSGFRQDRVTTELLLFAAGLAMIPLLVLILSLGSRELAGPTMVWGVLIIPGLAAIVAIANNFRERRAFMAHRPNALLTAPLDVSKLSGPWYDSFEAVRRDQSLGRGSMKAPLAGRVGAIIAGLVLVAAVLLLVPMLVAGTVGPAFWVLTIPKFANTTSKLEIASIARPYETTKDARITPLAAGAAFYSLVLDGERRRSRFAETSTPTVKFPDRPWKEPLRATLFPTAKPDQVRGLPSSLDIIQAAAHGLNAEQMAFLGRVAAAEQWKAFSIVAHAPKTDYIGARYVLPFADTAGGWWEFPILHAQPIKELAYAGVARAAYHLARGQRDSAETALREIVSFGFQLVDNGSSLVDELVGIVMTGIGRHGLIQFYKAIGDPRGVELQSKLDSVVALVENRSDRSEPLAVTYYDPTRLREMVGNVIVDRKASRGLRMAMLQLYAAAPCTNMRELVFGAEPDVRRAFDSARQTWAQFPSDTGFIDLVEKTPERLRSFGNPQGAASVMVRLATIEGALLGNRRLAGCATLATQAADF